MLEAVNPKSPLPPVEVRTGDDSVPSSTEIFKEIICDPAGSLFKKYAALLSGLSLSPMAAAETSDGTRRYVRACILIESLQLEAVTDEDRHLGSRLPPSLYTCSQPAKRSPLDRHCVPPATALLRDGD